MRNIVKLRHSFSPAVWARRRVGCAWEGGRCDNSSFWSGSCPSAGLPAGPSPWSGACYCSVAGGPTSALCCARVWPHASRARIDGEETWRHRERHGVIAHVRPAPNRNASAGHHQPRWQLVQGAGQGTRDFPHDRGCDSARLPDAATWRSLNSSPARRRSRKAMTQLHDVPQ